MYGLLRKNKGFLLVSAYMGVLVLVILGVALFGRTVHEHKFATITMDELSARYAAERGVDYAIAELKLNSAFKTHTTSGSNGNYTIVPTTGTVPTPQLANVAIVDGCYASQFPTGDSQFITKIYSDPYLIGEAVILSKGLSNGQTVLLVTKYVPSSLYRFFFFTPYDFWPQGNYDAGGGSMHANGHWWLGGTTYSNIREMSTAKYFKYSYNYYIPPAGTATLLSGATTPNNPRTGLPYTWDDVFYNYRYPYQTGNTHTNEPSEKYKNWPDGYQGGSWGYGLLWRHPNGQIYELGWTYPALPPGAKPEDYILDPWSSSNLAYYACNNHAASCSNDQLISWSHATVNNIRIPNYFNTGYNFNKYWQLETGFGFDNKTWGYTPENMTKYQFNSQYQLTDWASFLASQHAPGNGPTLQSVLKDANTGGTYIQPLSIQGAFYSEKAQTGGIHIKNTATVEGLMVKIKNYNNDQYISIDELGGQLVINGFTVLEKKSFVDVESTATINAVQLNIGNLKQALGNNANLDQNIIYSDYPIIITNARDILDNGLTTICENNIYLHGNYNDTPTTGGETFKPSAAISGRRVYTLSGTWDYPQTLQYTSRNPDYPHKWDFYCPSTATTCISRLISEGRNIAETTSPSYPDGYNWYADHYNQMAHAVPADSDPATPGINPYVYNVALVGVEGYYPAALERWSYNSNPGDNSTQPSNGVGVVRNIYGAQIRLESADFPGSGNWNWGNRRCCGTFSAPCADCSTYYDSSPSPVNSGGLTYRYNVPFAEGDVPPGDLLGYSNTVFVELEDNTTNWTKHYDKISMIHN